MPGFEGLVDGECGRGGGWHYELWRRRGRFSANLEQVGGRVGRGEISCGEVIGYSNAQKDRPTSRLLYSAETGQSDGRRILRWVNVFTFGVIMLVIGGVI